MSLSIAMHTETYVQSNVPSILVWVVVTSLFVKLGMLRDFMGTDLGLTYCTGTKRKVNHLSWLMLTYLSALWILARNHRWWQPTLYYPSCLSTIRWTKSPVMCLMMAQPCWLLKRYQKRQSLLESGFHFVRNSTSNLEPLKFTSLWRSITWRTRCNQHSSKSVEPWRLGFSIPAFQHWYSCMFILLLISFVALPPDIQVYFVERVRGVQSAGQCIGSESSTSSRGRVDDARWNTLAWK